MRRIFTSPRLENAERVAALLKDNGIEARITNGRSYKGNRRGNFSYRDDTRTDPQPAVWIVKPDDQPKARELMREAGLLDSGRSPTSYLSTAALQTPADERAQASKRRRMLIRAALLVGIVITAGAGLLATRKPVPALASKPAVALPQSTIEPMPSPGNHTIADTDADTAYRVDVPSALAAMLLQAELRAHDAFDACLSVDGKPPSKPVLDALPEADRARIRAQADCAAAADAKDVVSVDVREYLTDGSGIGTVQVEIADHGKDGKRRVDTRTLDVKRDGLDWKIKRTRL